VLTQAVREQGLFKQHLSREEEHGGPTHFFSLKFAHAADQFRGL
jgi:hypothetical protein